MFSQGKREQVSHQCQTTDDEANLQSENGAMGSCPSLRRVAQISNSDRRVPGDNRAGRFKWKGVIAQPD